MAPHPHTSDAEEEHRRNYSVHPSRGGRTQSNIPRRWSVPLLEDGVKRHLVPDPLISLSFDAGPRIRLGQRFVYHRTSRVIARIAQGFGGSEFDIGSNPETEPPTDWTLKDFCLSNLPVHHYLPPCCGAHRVSHIIFRRFDSDHQPYHGPLLDQYRSGGVSTSFLCSLPSSSSPHFSRLARRLARYRLFPSSYGRSVHHHHRPHAPRYDEGGRLDWVLGRCQTRVHGSGESFPAIAGIQGNYMGSYWTHHCRDILGRCRCCALKYDLEKFTTAVFKNRPCSTTF